MSQCESVSAAVSAEDGSYWHRNVGVLKHLHCSVSTDSAGVDMLKLWGSKAGYRLNLTSLCQYICMHLYCAIKMC